VAASAYAPAELQRDRLSGGIRTFRYHSKPVIRGAGVKMPRKSSRASFFEEA